jgi:hypothetical protein
MVRKKSPRLPRELSAAHTYCLEDNPSRPEETYVIPPRFTRPNRKRLHDATAASRCQGFPFIIDSWQHRTVLRARSAGYQGTLCLWRARRTPHEIPRHRSVGSAQNSDRWSLGYALIWHQASCQGNFNCVLSGRRIGRLKQQRGWKILIRAAVLHHDRDFPNSDRDPSLRSGQAFLDCNRVFPIRFAAS